MIKILCPSCKKHIYNMVDEPVSDTYVNADEFIPASKSIRQPKYGELFPKCPYCKTSIITDDIMVLTDKGYLPHEI